MRRVAGLRSWEEAMDLVRVMPWFEGLWVEACTVLKDEIILRTMNA
jgi:hypothetical protein